MKILVCGGRNWTDGQLVLETLRLYPTLSTVIEGGARGADTCARWAAKKLKVECKTFPAKWDEYGKGAGMVRNRQMLTEEKPDLVLAFHDNLHTESKGTKHMLILAHRAGVESRLITHTKEVKYD